MRDVKVHAKQPYVVPKEPYILYLPQEPHILPNEPQILPKEPYICVLRHVYIGIDFYARRQGPPDPINHVCSLTGK